MLDFAKYFFYVYSGNHVVLLYSVYMVNYIGFLMLNQACTLQYVLLIYWICGTLLRIFDSVFLKDVDL